MSKCLQKKNKFSCADFFLRLPIYFSFFGKVSWNWFVGFHDFLWTLNLYFLAKHNKKYWHMCHVKMTYKKINFHDRFFPKIIFFLCKTIKKSFKNFSPFFGDHVRLLLKLKSFLLRLLKKRFFGIDLTKNFRILEWHQELFTFLKGCGSQGDYLFTLKQSTGCFVFWP